MLQQRHPHISNAHWQPKISRLNASVTDLEDIEQGIRLTVLTPLGSCPGDPLKGCNYIEYKDRDTLNDAPQAAASILQALNYNNPRIVVENVSVDFSADDTAHFDIHYRIRGDVLAKIYNLKFSDGRENGLE